MPSGRPDECELLSVLLELGCQADEDLSKRLQCILIEDGRPALLAYLRNHLGVEKLGVRQRVANLVGRLARSTSTADAAAAPPAEELIPVVKPSASPSSSEKSSPSLLQDDCLSVGCLRALMDELLCGYRDPQFQAQLALSYRQQNPSLALQSTASLVLTSVQAPVLKSYGLSPDASGVEALKQMVHRRIAEGASDLHDRSNEARRLLRLRELPPRHQSAEAMLADMVTTNAGQLAVATSSPEDEQVLLLEVKHGSLSRRSAEFVLAQMREGRHKSAVLSSMFHMACQHLPYDALVGAGIGNAGSGAAELHGVPHARSFFNEYVLRSRPAVLRGFADAERFPPMALFADFDYMRRRCGHRRIPMRCMGLDDSDGRKVFITKSENNMPFGAFLEAIEQSEASNGRQRMPFYAGGLALAKDLPELSEEVARASLDPARALGECFGEPIETGVYTYFGGGRNVTPIHYDTCARQPHPGRASEDRPPFSSPAHPCPVRIVACTDRR